MKTKTALLTSLMILFFTVANAQDVSMTVNLNVIERFAIASLLPENASFATWGILNELRLELSPTDAELKLVDPQQTADGKITGKWDAVPKKEIVFGSTAEKIIADALRKMDSEGNLLAEHLSIYKKFVIKENK